MSPERTSPQLNTDLARRLEQLAERRQATAPGSGPSTSQRRRRHPARKSRIAALALSLATTAGLAAGFAATDGPASSVVSASGGVVTDLPGTGTAVHGNVYTNKWGPVQVQATFAPDGSITAVDAVQVPSADGKSVRINDRAVPTLNSEALTTQTANVDTVSGATYTSVDYERSLQSAIDVARAAGLTQIA